VDTAARSWHGGKVSELNATAAALLGLLHEGPATGGQLVSAARDRFGSFFSVTRSQVYRELPALADAGLVRLGKQGPRSSQQYLVTAAGKKAFKGWLSSEPGPDHLRSPLILRLVHADALTAKQRAALIDSAKKAYSEEHEAAKTAVKTADGAYSKAIAEFSAEAARLHSDLLNYSPEANDVRVHG
jgi:DNA-binding PadR family transcriptional regulator